MNAKLAFLISFALVLSACQTSTTQMTRPRALKPLHPEVTVNLQGGVTASVLEDAEALSDSLVNDAQSGEPLTEEEVRQLLDSSLRLILFQPSIAPEAIIRLGVADAPLGGIDVGVRYNGALVKGDIKWQLLGDDESLQALALFLGYAHHISVASSLIEYGSLSEFSRSDVDVGLSYGFEFGDFGGIYIGPRFLYSWTDVTPKLDEEIVEQFPPEYRDLEPSQYFEDEEIMFVGATGALYLGYSAVYLVIEASVFKTIFEPIVLGEKTDLGGVYLSPSIGLMTSF